MKKAWRVTNPWLAANGYEYRMRSTGPFTLEYESFNYHEIYGFDVVDAEGHSFASRACSVKPGDDPKQTDEYKRARHVAAVMSAVESEP